VSGQIAVCEWTVDRSIAGRYVHRTVVGDSPTTWLRLHTLLPILQLALSFFSTSDAFPSQLLSVSLVCVQLPGVATHPPAFQHFLIPFPTGAAADQRADETCSFTKYVRIQYSTARTVHAGDELARRNREMAATSPQTCSRAEGTAAVMD
jgi:hypothetical protein